MEEISLLSSYSLPPLEPPVAQTAISRGTAGAAMGAKSGWQVERSAEAPAGAGRTLNMPREGISVGVYEVRSVKNHALSTCSEGGRSDNFSTLCNFHFQTIIHSTNHQINQPKTPISNTEQPFTLSSSSIFPPVLDGFQPWMLLRIIWGVLQILMLDVHPLRDSDLNGLRYGLGILIFSKDNSRY